MSGLQQARDNYEVNEGVASCSKSLEESIATVDEQCEINLTRDQRVANIEKQVEKLNNEIPLDNTAIPDHLTRLQLLYKQLVEKLSAPPVAAILLQNDKLTFTEYDKITFTGTPSEKAEKLLKQLLRKGIDCSSYSCFLTALETTSQGHLLLWLTHDDFDIDSQHINLIRQNYTYLREQLNPLSTGLGSLLYERGVIDQEEMERLDAGGGALCQAELLLTMLSRKSADQFEQFLVALELTEQEHVAQELRRCLPPVESPDAEPARLSDAKNRETGASDCW